MIDLHPSERTITVALPTGTAVMAAPSIGQWRQIRAAYRQAEEKITAAGDTDRGTVLFDDAVYAAAFAVAVHLCAGVAEPDPDQLPAEATSPDLYRAMHDMWTVPRITVDGQPWTPGTPITVASPADAAFTPMPDPMTATVAF